MEGSVSRNVVIPKELFDKIISECTEKYYGTIPEHILKRYCKISLTDKDHCTVTIENNKIITIEIYNEDFPFGQCDWSIFYEFDHDKSSIEIIFEEFSTSDMCDLKFAQEELKEIEVTPSLDYLARKLFE